MPRLLSHGFFPHPPAGPSPVCRRTRGTGYTIPGGALFLSLQPLSPPVARTFPPVLWRTGGAGHAPSGGALSSPYGPLSSNCRQSPLTARWGARGTKAHFLGHYAFSHPPTPSLVLRQSPSPARRRGEGRGMRSLGRCAFSLAALFPRPPPGPFTLLSKGVGHRARLHAHRAFAFFSLPLFPFVAGSSPPARQMAQSAINPQKLFSAPDKGPSPPLRPSFKKGPRDTRGQFAPQLIPPGPGAHLPPPARPAPGGWPPSPPAPKPAHRPWPPRPARPQRPPVCTGPTPAGCGRQW